jgi:hypothetical protein
MPIRRLALTSGRMTSIWTSTVRVSRHAGTPAHGRTTLRPPVGLDGTDRHDGSRSGSGFRRCGNVRAHRRHARASGAALGSPSGSGTGFDSPPRPRRIRARRQATAEPVFRRQRYVSFEKKGSRIDGSSLVMKPTYPALLSLRSGDGFVDKNRLTRRFGRFLASRWSWPDRCKREVAPVRRSFSLGEEARDFRANGRATVSKIARASTTG